LSLIQSIWARANDAYLRIDTQEQSSGNGRPLHDSSAAAKYDDCVDYQGADYRNLRRVIRELRLSPEDVFFDIGCGKGRVICLAARERLQGVIGIELSETLCAVARQNAERVRGRKTPVEVRCGDAATADITGGTVFFLYNPFGAETLREVLANIRRSAAHARKVTIVYYNSVHSDVFESETWLRPIRELRTLTGKRISFWEVQI
jgi:SAM-dependent methyltransferase